MRSSRRGVPNLRTRRPASDKRATGPPLLGIDELAIKAKIGEILNRWPAVGLAVGVVRDGRLDFFHGHVESHHPSTRERYQREHPRSHASPLPCRSADA